MKNLISWMGFIFAMMAIFFVSNFININITYAAKVNINTASATELDTIPEVGPSTAAKIITYRETIGLFLVIEDIMKVSGIKQATFDKLKDFITVTTEVLPVDNIDISTTTSTSTNNEGNTGTTTATTTITINQVVNVVSVHYIQEELSNYIEPINIFEISAGRNRLAYVDSPISFISKYKTSKDVAGRNCDYFWTFGDGTSQPGEKVFHTYKYAGEYNVVVNGSCNDLHSVSRTIVKVILPNVTINSRADGSVEIINNGKYEISLYDWKVVAGDQSYIFPIDTIISAGKKVIFPAEYLKISAINNDIALFNASSKEVTRAKINLAILNPDKVIPLANFEKFVVEYRKNNPDYIKKTNKPVSVPLTASVISAFVSTTSASDQVENLGSTIPAEVPVRGFWSKLFHPIRTIRESFYQ